MALWRNGRRARLKSGFLRECWFKSNLGYFTDRSKWVITLLHLMKVYPIRINLSVYFMAEWWNGRHGGFKSRC